MSAVRNVWRFYFSIVFAICKAERKTNVQIPLLDNNKAPLYADFNMSGLNQQLRKIFKQEVDHIIQNTVNGIYYDVGGRNVNRYLPNGDWRWIQHGKATKMTYVAFAFHQGPGGTTNSENDCMFFYVRDRFKFHDHGCDNGSYLGGYICEI